MMSAFRLETLLAGSSSGSAEQLDLFALLNLGVIESLTNGLPTASDALRVFYNAENCLFVRKRLRDKIADRVMSHGVQLPDLFSVLPAEEAHREFQHELAAMRSLCLKLLEEQRLVA